MPKCHSTNDIASDMLNAGNPPEGTIIITDNQEKGKGQRGNSWQSAPGKNLIFSVILKPGFLLPEHQFLLNMVVTLAIIDELSLYLKKGLKIKWPNDIYFDNLKIGGVLIESQIGSRKINSSVIGIGINVNQIIFDNLPQATSMAIICQKEFDLFTLLYGMMKRLEQRYIQLKQRKQTEIRENYLQNLFWYNEVHRFESDHVFNGKIIGIDDFGKLVIETDEGELRNYDLKTIKFLIPSK